MNVEEKAFVIKVDQKRLNLPEWIRTLLENCPCAKGGVHKWIFRVACALKPHMNYELAYHLIKAGSEGCGRIVGDRELNEAIAAAKRSTPSQGQKQKWPVRNEEQIEAIVSNGEGLAELWESSPILLQDDASHTEVLIDQLFPDNPLLCIGKSAFQFDTRPREDWRGEMPSMELIVPSPMSSRTGLTKKGKKSTHTLNNTGPRKYQVVEFDDGTFDAHSSILAHLSQDAPLVMALMSGNKSLHGWFNVSNSTENLQYGFMRRAVSLGADPQLWVRSQFARLPDGFRKDKGKRQSVIFFNPSNLPQE